MHKPAHELPHCRYDLKADVRTSLYDYCNQWAEAIGSNRQFMGGATPNLADLVSLMCSQTFYHFIHISFPSRLCTEPSMQLRGWTHSETSTPTQP